MGEQKDLAYAGHVHVATRYKKSLSNVLSNRAHSLLSVFTFLFVPNL